MDVGPQDDIPLFVWDVDGVILDSNDICNREAEVAEAYSRLIEETYAGIKKRNSGLEEAELRRLSAERILEDERLRGELASYLSEEGPISAIPDFRKRLELRGLVTKAHHYSFVRSITRRGLLESARSELERLDRETLNEEKERISRRFYIAREMLKSSDYLGWLSRHTPYRGIDAQLERAKHLTGVQTISTSKDEATVRDLLSHFGYLEYFQDEAGEEYIFGNESGGKSEKMDIIASYFPGRPRIFIEDLEKNLSVVKKEHPEVFSVLSEDGYQGDIPRESSVDCLISIDRTPQNHPANNVDLMLRNYSILGKVKRIN
jgi:phosphoglycolate phosphatase-like HAD superfamily hydrolase